MVEGCEGRIGIEQAKVMEGQAGTEKPLAGRLGR